MRSTTPSSSIHRNLDRCIRLTTDATAIRNTLLMSETPEQPDLTRSLLDAVALFESIGIRYALVGGLAAMVYGRSRFTEDVDFVAASEHQQILENHPDEMKSHGFDPTCTWKLYHTSGCQIDLWKDSFADQIVLRAVAVELAGRSVQVAEPHDLIAMKLRADRPQDDYDISEVLKRADIQDAIIRERVDDEQYQSYLAIKKRIGLTNK